MTNSSVQSRVANLLEGLEHDFQLHLCLNLAWYQRAQKNRGEPRLTPSGHLKPTPSLFSILLKTCLLWCLLCMAQQENLVNWQPTKTSTSALEHLITNGNLATTCSRLTYGSSQQVQRQATRQAFASRLVNSSLVVIASSLCSTTTRCVPLC